MAKITAILGSIGKYSNRYYFMKLAYHKHRLNDINNRFSSLSLALMDFDFDKILCYCIVKAWTITFFMNFENNLCFWCK